MPDDRCVQPVLGHSRRNRAEHAKGGGRDDDAHHAREKGRKAVDELRDGRTCLTQSRQAAAQQHGEEQDLENIAVGKGSDRRAGNEVENKACHALAVQRMGIGGIACHGMGVFHARRVVHAAPRMEQQAAPTERSSTIVVMASK